MNRYDSHFRNLPPSEQDSLNSRLTFARIALSEHRNLGFSFQDDDEIVKQFGIPGMKEFWEAELSEIKSCRGFADCFGIHFISPKDAESSSRVKAHIYAALKVARAEGEPWFLDVPAPQLSRKLDPNGWKLLIGEATFVPDDPPRDGIDLSKLRVRPRGAAEWLLTMPRRRHLVPPSLAKLLKNQIFAVVNSTSDISDSPVEKSGAPGRPTSMHLAEGELRRRAAAGEMESTMVDEANLLAAWLKRVHPNAPPLGAKTIRNSLGGLYKRSRNPS